MRRVRDRKSVLNDTLSVRRAYSRAVLSLQTRTRQEDLAGTSFTCILHPLRFRLSSEDYAKYYFAGGPGAREWRKYK